MASVCAERRAYLDRARVRAGRVATIDASCGPARRRGGDHLVHAVPPERRPYSPCCRARQRNVDQPPATGVTSAAGAALILGGGPAGAAAAIALARAGRAVTVIERNAQPTDK